MKNSDLLTALVVKLAASGALDPDGHEVRFSSNSDLEHAVELKCSVEAMSSALQQLVEEHSN